MKLICCEECGIVLNQDAILFPLTHDDNYELINDNVVWDDKNDFVAKTNCHVRRAIIKKEG